MLLKNILYPRQIGYSIELLYRDTFMWIKFIYVNIWQKEKKNKQIALQKNNYGNNIIVAL